MSWVAAAVVGGSLIGAGASIYGANQQSKTIKAGSDLQAQLGLLGLEEQARQFDTGFKAIEAGKEYGINELLRSRSNADDFITKNYSSARDAIARQTGLQGQELEDATQRALNFITTASDEAVIQELGGIDKADELVRSISSTPSYEEAQRRLDSGVINARNTLQKATAGAEQALGGLSSAGAAIGQGAQQAQGIRQAGLGAGQDALTTGSELAIRAAQEGQQQASQNIAGAGQQAQQALQTGAGQALGALGAGTQGALAAGQPYQAAGQAGLEAFAQNALSGELSPLAQLQLQEGSKQLNEQLAARGLLNSGAALEAQNQLAQQVLAQEADKQRMAQQSLAGMGQAQVGATQGLLSQQGLTSANILGGLGQGQAALAQDIGAQQAGLAERGGARTADIQRGLGAQVAGLQEAGSRDLSNLAYQGAADQAAYDAQQAQQVAQLRAGAGQQLASGIMSQAPISSQLAVQQGQEEALRQQQLADLAMQRGRTEAGYTQNLGQQQAALATDLGSNMANIYGGLGSNLANLYTGEGSQRANTLMGASTNMANAALGGATSQANLGQQAAQNVGAITTNLGAGLASSQQALGQAQAAPFNAIAGIGGQLAGYGMGQYMNQMMQPKPTPMTLGQQFTSYGLTGNSNSPYKINY